MLTRYSEGPRAAMAASTASNRASRRGSPPQKAQHLRRYRCVFCGTTILEMDALFHISDVLSNIKKEKCAFAHLYFDQYTMQGEKQQPELTAGAGTAILEKTERRYRK